MARRAAGPPRKRAPARKAPRRAPKTSRRPARSTESLFARWFLLVYLPLVALALSLVLWILGLLPGWFTPVLILLAAYSTLALRLLFERRRSGVGGQIPAKLLTGLATVSGLAVAGAILIVLGMERLTSSTGLAVAAVGGFLMILSVTVPTFRLVDVILRAAARAVKAVKGSGSGPKGRPRRLPAGRSSQSTPGAKPRTRSPGTRPRR